MNLSWSPSVDEIKRADELRRPDWVYRIMRPFPYELVLRAWVSSLGLYFLGGVAGVLAAAMLSGVSRLHRFEMWFAGGSALAFSAFILVVVVFATPEQIVRSVPLWPLVALPITMGVVAVFVHAAYTRTEVPLLLFVEAPCIAVYTFRPWIAGLVVSLVPLLYGVILAIHHDPAWFLKWFALTSTVVGISVVVGTIATRGEVLHASEQAARKELEALNETLEARVDEQVAEVTRLSRLQRFLSPSIAEAVASSEHESLLAPHRRKIAVFFCDLRGFTAFTNRSEPEEVLAVLDDYYQSVGRVLRKYGATIGGYAGDGIMAFFGDPVPTPNPARDAVAMAVELRSVMAPVVEQWNQRAYRLGYGSGIAYGHATLGAVGTDGRFDYTPLGAVVNLAARLCAKAVSDQVLLDRETHLATLENFPSTNVGAMELKGFADDVAVYALEP